MQKRILFIGLFVLGTIIAWGQDPVFSQFFAAPMQTNPALTGGSFAPRLIANYRNQWPSFNKAYVTYSASYDQYFESANSGLGFMVLSDVAGDGIYLTNKVSGFYSYNLALGDDFFIKGGLEAGFGQKRVNWDKLVFLDQIDPITGAVNGAGDPNISQEIRPENESKSYFDASIGMIAYTEKFYGGVSLKHINAPDESIIGGENNDGIIPLRLTLHAGAEINFGKKNNKSRKSPFISPNIMFIKQGEFSQVNVGAYASLGMLFGGTWFRYSGTNSDAVIVLVGVQRRIVKIGYSYDITVSKLSSETGGAHEVSMIINFDNSNIVKKKRRAKQYTNCLKIFN